MFQNRMGKILSLGLMMFFAVCTVTISQRVESSSAKKGDVLVTDKGNLPQAAADLNQNPQPKGQITLTLKVVDSEDAQKISNAEVFVSFDSDEQPQSKKTNAQGSVKIRLAQGEVNIKVIATGYKTYEEKRDVQDNEEIVVKLVKE